MSMPTLEALQSYTACDISDALLKLQTPEPGKRALGGFLDGLKPITPLDFSTPRRIVVAPASTVQFIPKGGVPDATIAQETPSDSLIGKRNWSDLTQPETIVVIQQPRGQKCAVVGGIMALRMSKLGARGVVVSGRVRDVEELNGTGLPVWARATSTVGTGAEAEAYAFQIRLVIDEVEIAPDDVVFCDSIDGIVVIPQALLGAVLELLPKLKEDDDTVKKAVAEGMSVKEAFTKFRRKP